MPLILKVIESMSLTLSIDPDYGVHDDFKEHTSGSFTMGKGSLYTVSCKQKVNTKSSTAAEPVAVDDYALHMSQGSDFSCWHKVKNGLKLLQSYKTTRVLSYWNKIVY